AAGTMIVAACANPTLQEWFGNSAKLSGAQEVPPVTTAAAGRSTLAVNEDRTVSGSVKVWDIKPTAAHIHQGAKGQNGPVILPLTKKSDPGSSDTTFEPAAN